MVYPNLETLPKPRLAIPNVTHSPRRILSSEDTLTFKGTVLDSSKGVFRVELENAHVVIGHLSGKMKLYKIRVLPGDSVTVELSPYDLNRGRIVQREKVTRG